MHQLQVEVEVEDQVVRDQTELPSSRPGWQSWQGTMRSLSHPFAFSFVHGHWLFTYAQDEEWRTVYVGFVERGTTEQELADHFKVKLKFVSFISFLYIYNIDHL